MFWWHLIFTYIEQQLKKQLKVLVGINGPKSRVGNLEFDDTDIFLYQDIAYKQTDIMMERDNLCVYTLNMHWLYCCS